jgi:ketosteroid isomerase-like protein
MKNYLTLAGLTLLAMASLCLGQSNIDKAAKTSGKAMSQSSLDKALIEREKAVWETIKNKQFDAFREFYADNFRAVSADGFHDIHQEVEGARDVDLKDYSLTDMKVVTPNKDTAILTFKVTVRGSYKGEDISGVYYASAVWVNQNGKWLAILYTEAKAQ